MSLIISENPHSTQHLMLCLVTLTPSLDYKLVGDKSTPLFHSHNHLQCSRLNTKLLNKSLQFLLISCSSKMPEKESVVILNQKHTQKIDLLLLQIRVTSSKPHRGQILWRQEKPIIRKNRTGSKTCAHTCVKILYCCNLQIHYHNFEMMLINVFYFILKLFFFFTSC